MRAEPRDTCSMSLVFIPAGSVALILSSRLKVSEKCIITQISDRVSCASTTDVGNAPSFPYTTAKRNILMIFLTFLSWRGGWV